MKHRNLLADVVPFLVFTLAAILFLLGWFDTDRVHFLGAAGVLAIGAAYQLYRLRSLYIRQ
ncbi:MAG: hypothetical protein ABEJ60_06175 [Halodesulfurarchaeum sp.]